MTECLYCFLTPLTMPQEPKEHQAFVKATVHVFVLSKEKVSIAQRDRERSGERRGLGRNYWSIVFNYLERC